MTYHNKKTIDLTESQKIRIKTKKLKDFFQELDKLTEDKIKYAEVFSGQLEALVKKFDQKGMTFFGIEIELPFLGQNKNQESDIWETVHQDVEEFINYIGCHVELVELCYFSIEMRGRIPLWQAQVIKNENNEYQEEEKMFPCLNGIVGVRSLVGKDELLFFELKDVFIMSSYDIKLKKLFNYNEILTYWYNLIRQKNFKFHRFVNYSNFYANVYGAIADEELKFEDREAFGQVDHFISDTMNIRGVTEKFPKKKELVLLFINLFMGHKKFKIHENKIYCLIEGSQISWQLVCVLDEIKKNFKKMFNYLLGLYPQQLGNFNISNLLLSDLNSVFSKINNNNSLLLDMDIDFFADVIEFKDGLFFLETKKFLSFIEVSGLKDLKTIFFIECSFFDLNSAEYWLSLFNYNNNNKFLFIEPRANLDLDIFEYQSESEFKF
jgi:hypothetical protein